MGQTPTPRTGGGRRRHALIVVIRLLLDALEAALSRSGRRSPVATAVSAILTVVALGATLWILSAAPPGLPAASIAAGIDALRRAAPPPAAAVAASWSPLPAPLPAMMPPGAGIPIWPWLLAAVVVGAIWRGRARPRRRRLRRVGAELPLLAANWRRAAARRRAFLRGRARRRAEEARDGAR
jgi:hypothetical protein